MIFITKGQVYFIEKLNGIACKVADFYNMKLTLLNCSFRISNDNCIRLPIYHLSYPDLQSLGYTSYNSDVMVKDEVGFLKTQYPLYTSTHILQKYILYCKLKHETLLDTYYLDEFLSDLYSNDRIKYRFDFIIQNINDSIIEVNTYQQQKV